MRMGGDPKGAQALGCPWTALSPALQDETRPRGGREDTQRGARVPSGLTNTGGGTTGHCKVPATSARHTGDPSSLSRAGRRGTGR